MKRRNKDRSDVVRGSSRVFEDEAISVIKRCRMESGEVVGIFEEVPYINRFPRTNQDGDPIEEIDFRTINNALKELAEMRRFRQGMKMQTTPENTQSTNDSQPMDEVIMTDDGESHYP